MARTSSDTHTALLMNRVTNYLAGMFLFLLLVAIIVFYSIGYSINRDCTNTYHRYIKLPGHWLNITSGSTKKDCPQQ